jgi:hypothetical protein
LSPVILSKITAAILSKTTAVGIPVEILALGVPVKIPADIARQNF